MKITKLISDIRKLIAGTHFVTAYGKRGGKRGPREVKGNPAIARVADMENTGESHIISGAKLTTILDSLESEQECIHGRGMTDYCEPCGRIHGTEPSDHALSDTIGGSGDGYAGPRELAPLPKELIERDRLIIEGMREGGDHENR